MFAISKNFSEPNIDNEKPRYKVNTEAIYKGTRVCVIVLNDSPVIHDEIVSAIKYIPHITEIIVSTKDDYFKKHSNKNIDIVITDIEFGNKIETSIVKQIKAISPKTDIIVYTRIDSPTIKTRLLKDGADAFIQLGSISSLLESIVKVMVKKNYNSQH